MERNVSGPNPEESRLVTRRRYEAAIVLAFAFVFVALWVLSFAGVRAQMAARAWDRGDVEGAYRLAARATRQRPELADMWLLQGRCEERLGAPCKASLSYTRGVLAANELAARRASEMLATGEPAEAGLDEALRQDGLGDLRDTALRQSLTAAAACESVSTLATVFEALTVGVPSAPEHRSGIWPGLPEIATNRPTAETLATMLPSQPELQLRWIDFLWRRQSMAAALGATERLRSGPDTVPTSGLWLLSQVLLASGKTAEAIDVLEQSLRQDADWLPAAAALLELGADMSSSRAWNEETVALESAQVDAPVFELRQDALILATNGSVVFELDVPNLTGRAFLALDIWGTPANGRFPEVEVFVGGAHEAALEATGIALPLIVEILADVNGRATVSFVFSNDWADATGDRNVFFGTPTLYLPQ